jgi:hypothetical protein
MIRLAFDEGAFIAMAPDAGRQRSPRKDRNEASRAQ